MANKKDEEIKNTTKKKSTSKSNTTKKNSTVKKSTTNKKSTSTKNSSNTKKASTKNTTNNKSVKKVDSTKTSTAKKNTTKKVENKEILKKDIIVEENIINLEEKVEFPDNYVNIEDNNISEQEKDEKIIVEEINNITKLENAKYIKSKKKKNLLPIGVVIAILGLIALIISLIANRIVDREYLSDTAITLMLVISIIIETFGAFIIISES